jgi:hypothetical protein
MAKFESVKIAFPAEVEVAISKAQVLAHFIGRIVHGEGRGFRLVVDNDGTGKELDVTGLQIAVLSTFIPVASFSAYLDNTFGFKFGEEFGKGLVFGVEYDLSLTFSIAKV